MTKKDSSSDDTKKEQDVIDSNTQINEQYLAHTMATNEVGEQDRLQSQVDASIRAQHLGYLADKRLLRAGHLSVADLQADLALGAKALADQMAIKVATNLKTQVLNEQTIAGALAVGELSKVASIALTQYAHHKQLEEGASEKPKLAKMGIIPTAVKKRLAAQQHTGDIQTVQVNKVNKESRNTNEH